MFSFGKNREALPVRAPVCRLETARLILRPAALEDYLQWRKVRAENYDYLKPYEPAWPPKCLEEEFFSCRVARLNRDWMEDRTYALLVFLKDEILIGGMNINNVARGAAQYGSLGYWLAENAQGHGYMTEAAAATLHHAFTELAFERINAATLPHNEKSKSMLKRLGFAEEGFAKSYVQIDGVRADHVLFGLTVEDYSMRALRMRTEGRG